MDRSRIFSFIQKSILSINPEVSPDDVSESSSLTQDLSFDSLRLEMLISSIKEELLDTEFTPWYVRASRRGEDTVSSLIDFIQRASARPGCGVP